MSFNRKVLIVDDNQTIHDDFHKVLCRNRRSSSIREVENLERDLFEEGSEQPDLDELRYEVFSAFQGKQAYDMILEAKEQGHPFALAFVDVRMPPGWDGIETIRHIWKVAPYTEIVICSAYNDYTWDEIIAELGTTDSLFFLKKPFDSMTTRQLALTLTQKWNFGRRIRQQVVNLEHEVEMRNKQMTQLTKRLEDQEEQLQRIEGEVREEKLISRAKTDFLVTMNNELRLSLNSIIGMNNLLMETHLTRKQAAFSTNIHDSSRVLKAIINEIMDFSKLISGKLDLESIPFHLPQVLREAGDWLDALGQDKNIAVTIRGEDTVPDSWIGDPGRLRQILTNFGGNGVKFAANGNVLIQVSHRILDNGKANLRFEISFQGRGPNRDERDRLMQSFIQADVFTPRQFVNAGGLGLAISKKLIELMGGRMGLTDEGEGGVFWFEVEMGLDEKDSTKSPHIDRGLKGLRVMLADANLAGRVAMLERALDWGMGAEGVSNGKEVIENLKAAINLAAPFELVITDFLLEDMDGFELSQLIRSELGEKAPKVVMLTDYGNRGDGAQARESGLSGYLVKPMTDKQLQRALEFVMNYPGDDLLVTKHNLNESLHF